MPAKVTPNSKGGYTVSTPNGVHAKNTTLEKANSQARLINAVDHGFKPAKHRTINTGDRMRHSSNT